MRILLADDDVVTRVSVAATLEMFGHEVLEASDGTEAWEVLQKPGAPMLVILDWMMPGMDGIDVCRRLRGLLPELPPYVIILTARDTQEDVLVALEAGADEFLAKPVNPLELKARVEVGRRLVSLQASLAEHGHRLQQALDQVRTLHGILPICSYCKKIRNDQQYWTQVEQYVSENTEAVFSHGICPQCWEIHVRPDMDDLLRQDQEKA